LADPDEVLRAACDRLGLDAGAAELIRAGSNTLYRLPGRVVARVGRAGRADLADKELRVARWLVAAGVPAVRLASIADCPIRIADRTVTFWQELPRHRRATMGEAAIVLRQLHGLPRPGFDLPVLAPLDHGLDELARAGHLDAADRRWLREKLAQLRQEYGGLPDGLPWRVVHGDAWIGNFVTTAAGPVMVDLERFAYGPPEWDLVSVGLSSITLGTHPPGDWHEFCVHYGRDVTRWDGFNVLRDIREIRKALFGLPPEKWDSALAVQARYRLACLRGRHGPRPWRWWPSP
jgi:Phosphotransferase enzyme family